MTIVTYSSEPVIEKAKYDKAVSMIAKCKASLERYKHGLIDDGDLADEVLAAISAFEKGEM